MGIVAGLLAATVWLVLWSMVALSLGIPLLVAVVVLVVGLLAAFAVGVRFGDPRLRGDPVARIEERQRAKRRFEARVATLETQERVRRLAQEAREADERAEARVRSIVERRHERRAAAVDDREGRGADEGT